MPIRNPEKRREYLKRYYIEHKSEIETQRKSFYKKNKHKIVAQKRRYYKANPERFKSYRLKSRYGLTLSEFHRRAAEQEQKCPICAEPDAKLVLDHDHDDSSIRGLICGRCNTGLGMLGDSIETLKSAIRYLEHARGTKDGPGNDSARDRRRVPRPNL